MRQQSSQRSGQLLPWRRWWGSVIGRGCWPVGLLVSGLSTTAGSTAPCVDGLLVGGVSRTTGSTVVGEAVPDA